MALHPRELGLFSAVQYSQPGFPFVPFDEDTTVRWTRSVRWHDRAEVWVPASQVYLPYRRVADEAFVAPSISTGLAAGPTFEAAVLGGLYEVLERDALAISWLHRLPPRRVPGAAVAASADVSAHLAEAQSWNVRFYDLSLDFSPAAVVAVMEYQNGDERVMSFGSACRLSCTHAVEKAFLEAAQGVGYVRALLHTYEDWTADPDFGNVDDFHKHAILYSKHPELRPRVRYLLDPSTMPADRRPPRIDTPAAGGRAGSPQAWTLAMLTEQLHAAGHPVLVVDLTTSDIRQLGVSVVRVLVPGLQHLAGAHRFRLLGNPRLHDVVGRLGYDSAPDNPYPHPLP